MKNFTPLTSSGFEYYKSIVETKNDTVRKQPSVKKNLLLGLFDVVEKKYLHYQSRFTVDDLHLIEESAFTDAEKEALLWAYTSGGAALDQLKKDIKNAQALDWQNKCPYCGISSINETDHYVPKEDFAEYAVFNLNLVPACGTCNKKKLSLWKLGATRKIINFYLDTLPDKQFLFCDFSYADGVPQVEYRLQREAGVSEPIYNLVKSHFERLDLLARYKEHSNEEITNVIDAVLSLSKIETAAILKADLLDQYDKKVLRYGVNHWRCVLLKEMACSESFTALMVAKIKDSKIAKDLGI